MTFVPGLALLLLGCGEDDGSAAGAGGNGSGGSSASTWPQQCESVADHNASCGKSSDDQAAVDDCVATSDCVPSVWSAKVVATVMSCLAKLPCGQEDDECISATQPDQTATNLALFQACQDKATECAGFQGCLETQFLISDELALDLQSCLDEPCDAVNDCLLTQYTAATTASGCTGELPFGG